MIARFALLGATLSFTAVVAAQSVNPAGSIQNRVNRYREVGAAYKTLTDQAKAGAIVKLTARIAARNIAQAAKDQYSWFPKGSGPESGTKTKAKSAIWSEPAKFRRAQDDFQTQAILMQKAVETGNLAEIKKQTASLGRSCKACHTSYRAD